MNRKQNKPLFDHITSSKNLISLLKIFVGAFTAWAIVAAIYTFWLYVYPVREKKLNQEQILNNLKEFNSLADIYLIPVGFIGLIGLGFTAARYSIDKDETRKKSAHELVIKLLEQVYSFRKNTDSVLGDKIFFYASRIDEIDSNTKNEINFLLNTIEEICIAINEDIIDDQIVDQNLIYILAEYRYVFEKYINKVGEDFNFSNKKYKPWGVLSERVDNGFNTKQQREIINKVRQKVRNKINNNYRCITFEFEPKVKHSVCLVNDSLKYYMNILNNLDYIVDVSIFESKYQEKTNNISSKYLIFAYFDQEEVCNNFLNNFLLDNFNYDNNQSDHTKSLFSIKLNGIVENDYLKQEYLIKEEKVSKVDLYKCNDN